MPSLGLLLPFALATLVFAVVPGPAILYTAAQTLARGSRGGLLAAAGIHVGGFAHVIAAAAGLSAALELVPDLYAAVRLAGAAYLVWLGWSMIRRRLDGEALPAVRDRDARRAFVESILVEALNPKAAMFYLAFLPQFVDPARGSLAAQIGFLGFLFIVLGLMSDSAYAMLAGLLRSQFARRPLALRLERYVSAGTYLGLGALTAWAKRN